MTRCAFGAAPGVDVHGHGQMDASVVHQDVDSAVGRYCALDDLADIVGVRDVGDIAEALDLVYRTAAVTGHDTRAVCGECLAEGPPQAAGCAGHDGDLAVENLAHGSSGAAMRPRSLLAVSLACRDPAWRAAR